MMEKKRSKGVTVLGVTTIILNCLLASPFLMLLLIPVEPGGDKLLKIPLGLIPLGLSIAGVFCGINLLRLVRLRFIFTIVNITLVYYLLGTIFAAMQKSPDLIALILSPIILNVIILWAITRPKVKEQFSSEGGSAKGGR